MNPYVYPLLRKDNNISFAQITVKIVSEHYGVSIDKVLSKSRKPELVKPRFICVAILRKMNIKLEDIAAIIGYKDHTSVIHALEDISNRLETEEDFKKDFQIILNKIYSS